MPKEIWSCSESEEPCGISRVGYSRAALTVIVFVALQLAFHRYLGPYYVPWVSAERWHSAGLSTLSRGPIVSSSFCMSLCFL
jgi:hypothetical protein